MKSNKNTFLKWVCPLLIISVVVCVTILVLVHVYLETLPEKELSRKFVLTNSKIRNYFGKIESISEGSKARATHFFGKAEHNGYNSFIVLGKKKSGEVIVYWTSTGSGKNFKVKRVELWRRGKLLLLIQPDSKDL